MFGLLWFILYLRAISKYKPPGVYIWGSYYRRLFSVSILGGYIWRGLLSNLFCYQLSFVTISIEIELFFFKTGNKSEDF